MAQLPLELTLGPHASFAGFVAGPNAAAVAHLQAIADGRRSESLWLFGRPATGKSHLLAAACRRAGEAGRRAIYVDLGTAAEPGLLGDLGAVAVVAIDSVDRAAGDPSWERALFSLYEARAGSGGIVAAARTAPRDCGFRLADLVSRASASAIYGVGYLGDDDLGAAVRRHAALRGLTLDDAAATYLLRRVSRDLNELTACLDRIDRYALAEQRRVTVPLLREALAPLAP